MVFLATFVIGFLPVLLLLTIAMERLKGQGVQKPSVSQYYQIGLLFGLVLSYKFTYPSQNSLHIA